MLLPEALRDMHVLVVDDEPANVELLLDILEDAGCTRVDGVTCARDALARCAERMPDLVVLDLHMPGTDGYGVLDVLHPAIDDPSTPPVLVLTADATFESRERAFASGARDYVCKPFAQSEVVMRVRNLLEERRLRRLLADENAQLAHAVRERTRDLETSRAEILQRLVLVAEYRDDATNHHAARIGRMSALLAAQLECPQADRDLIERAATLHDIGKIAISDSILCKPGRLTEDEFATMRTHTTIGATMLAGSASPILQMAERIALSHHERWDGAGYPEGRRGDESPLEARIVAVADVFDALTHERPYKAAWPVAQAVATIRAGAGSQFDAAVVAAFERLDAGALADPAEAPGAVLTATAPTSGSPRPR